MDSDKYNKSVVLICPTCGCSTLEELEHSDTGQSIRCPSCDRNMTKDELVRENGATIEAAVDEMKQELLQDVQKELNDMLKNAFKGSKNIRIS